MENMIDGLLIMAIDLLPLFFLLWLGGVFADYVLPHCPRLLRFIERILQVDLEGGEEWDQ